MKQKSSPYRVWQILCGLCLAAAPALCGAGDVAVTIRVHARAVAPGEPLRIELVSPEPLSSVKGTFLGQEVFLVRDGSSAEGEHWSGWTMVALDGEAGSASFELSGSSESGRPVAGSRAITVEPREFPEEHLSVASKYVSPSKETQDQLAVERKKLAAIYRQRRPVVTAGPFVRPVDGEPTSIFGTRRLYNGEPRSPHPGLDLRASTGTPIRASGAGLVVLSQELYYSGYTVILDHGGGLFTLYAHLSELGVREGDDVAAGAVLGLSGETGRVTGPHLHWGAKIGNRPFDPRALLDPSLF